ncbi:MAG: hypothetical protein ACE5JG_09700, partial [Planctomycetota bacterium]
MMRRIDLLAALLLLPLLVSAQDMEEGEARGDRIDHAESGVALTLPEGWERELEMEGGGVLLHAIYSRPGGKQVRFKIDVEPAADFDLDLWIEGQKDDRESWIGEKNITEAWTVDKDRVIGGTPAQGYVIAGNTKASDGKMYPLRFRVYGLVNEGWFVRIEELSYNDAHRELEEVLDRIWAAVEIRKPKPKELDLTPPVDADGAVFKDETGNVKQIKLPGGWQVLKGPPDTPDVVRRLVARRVDADGETVATLLMMRTLHPAAVFSQQTPTTLLDAEKGRWKEVYGHQKFNIETNEGDLLDGAEKSASYVISGWTQDEEDQIREAEELQKRGEKVKVPEFARTVNRGRIAMISPYVYLLNFSTRSARESENQALLGELASVFESFRFASKEPGLPPLGTGDGILGDTVSDPQNSEPRTERLFHPEVEFIVPPGFVQIKNTGAALEIAAQDAKFSSVQIILLAKHQNELPPRTRFKPKN